MLPVGGTRIKFSNKLRGDLSIYGDCGADANAATNRFAHSAGLGFSETLRDKTKLELYMGWSNLIQGALSQQTEIFKIVYDHQLNANHFISISAQKDSGIDLSTVNSLAGNTIAHIDFKTIFD